MKTLNSLSPGFAVKMMAGLLLLTIPCCTDTVQQISPSLASQTEDVDWVAMMDDLFYAPGIIVQNESAIQDALNAAKPGQIIYVEPGIYEENLTVDKPDIKLIGLQRGNEEKVVVKNPNPGKDDITITTKGIGTEIINIGNGVVLKEDSRAGLRHPKRARRDLQVMREEVGDGIAHYKFELPVGNGPFDVVRIHRVVRENRRHQPVRMKGSVFMLHGASLHFEAIFLKAGANSTDASTSPAVYLAENNIDVWGMDFAWTLVPPETSDFSFMEDWGVERDVDHALAAISVARLIRGFSRQGFGPMNLLGYSYGAGVAYAAAGRETQHHRIFRSINGIVAVDQALKYAEDQESNRLLACNAANTALEQINSGVFQSNGGQVFGALGGLATSAPNDPSPIFRGLTNFQAALFLGTSTFALPDPATPSWHFVGGEFDNNSFPLPTGLRYTDTDRWITLFGSLPPYQPQRTTYEMRTCVCDDEDVTIDDHFGDISAPILYLGAQGGFGTLGHFTSTLTSSADVTNHTVSLLPDDQRAMDFGHGDLFLADEAPDLVWSVLQQWLVNHNNPAF